WRWSSLANRLPAFFFLVIRLPPRPTLFPYTTLFRSLGAQRVAQLCFVAHLDLAAPGRRLHRLDAHWAIAQQQRAGEQCIFGRERSEEHTSELQSRENLVCRLLLEKKNK